MYCTKNKTSHSSEELLELTYVRQCFDISVLNWFFHRIVMCVYVWGGCTCHALSLAVRGQRSTVGFLFLSWISGIELSCQACNASALPAEPSHLP